MTPDSQQQAIVTHSGAHSLVLAGPGCGKTFLLARRLIHANAVEGIPFSSMLCLTFTNRAAREMNVRIEATIGRKPDDLFVGNLHRFCCRLLHANKLLDADSGILDEDDRDTWLADALGLRLKSERKQVTDLAMLLYEQEHDFPKGLWRKLGFTPDQSYINAATAYRDYKSANRLCDFDDLLLKSYQALSSHPPHTLLHSSYRWIQVDEVQDLTPLQLAIVDMITGKDKPTVMYLGDEQQAIFEFIGAGGPALDRLKLRCANSTFRLRRNYRSSPQLITLCNSLAANCLGISLSDLSTATPTKALNDDKPELLPASNFNLSLAVTAKVRAWKESHPAMKTAILTRTNDQAEEIARQLEAHGIENTLVGRNDLFRSVTYKTICAHMAIVAGAYRQDDWARLLYQCKAVKTLNEARGLMKRLSELHLDPAASLLGAAAETEGAGADFMSSAVVKKIIEKFASSYGPLYRHSTELFKQNDPSTASTLAAEMCHTHNYLATRGYIDKLKRNGAVFSFMARALCCGRTFREQLSTHIAELRTFNEGDLLEDELLTVITIHKAKGLEFDGVIVYDGGAKTAGGHDDARVHYVAMSRARHKLAVFFTGTLSASLASVASHFEIINPDEVEATALIERLHGRPLKRR